MSEWPKTRAARSVQTKRALKEAFCRLYLKKPINKIAITEVCRIAGYNRSTFYQYYLDVDDMLLEIETETLTYIATQRKTVHTSDSNFISELMELYEQEKVYMDAMLGPHSTPRFLDNLLQLAVQSNVDFDLQPDDPFFPYLVEFRYQGALSIFRLWLRRKRDLPFADLLAFIQKRYQI
jgi:AcrR family transcriptional regulator